MRRKISLILGELESKVSGYVALLNFRYFNLCVKAEPAALLPITITLDKREFDLEKVADVAKPNDFQFIIFPKDQSILFEVGKGIAQMHPEFKQELVVEDEKGKIREVSDDDHDEEKDKFIRLTMPTVNKDRHDLLVEGVKGLYDQCKLKLDTNFGTYGAQIAAKLAGADAEELDEAKDALEDLKKQVYELAETYRDNKLKEIEDAYQEYLEKQKVKEQSSKEEHDTHNPDVVSGFKMSEE